MESVLHFTTLVAEEACQVDFSKVCLVRSLKAYVQRTTVVRGQHTQLLFTFKQGDQGRLVTKTTIATWIKICVQEAYIQQHLPLVTTG